MTKNYDAPARPKVSRWSKVSERAASTEGLGARLRGLFTFEMSPAERQRLEEEASAELGLTEHRRHLAG